MKRKCKLRHIETHLEVIGYITSDDVVLLPNGYVANCQYWEIIDPIPSYVIWAASIATLVGAVFLGFIFWGDQ
jgi:hypothetical protein